MHEREQGAEQPGDQWSGPARIVGFVRSVFVADVASVRPMVHSAELDGCGGHKAGRAFVMSNPHANEEVETNTLLLPLVPNHPGLALTETSMRTRSALDHLLQSPCLCFDRIWGETGPWPVVTG